MPHYISLVKWTDQGIKNVRESPKRADQVAHLTEQLGGKMQLFYTMGEYDLVAITEAKDDETAMQLLLQLGTLGSVRTTTMKAWTPAQATKIIAKLQ
ncbi:MAG: GYD domain-containing protein [Candidatus Thermoplasmatota archaeon]